MDIFTKYQIKSLSSVRKQILSFSVKKNHGSSSRFAVVTLSDEKGATEMIVDERFFEQLRPYIEAWENNPLATVPCYFDGEEWRFSYKTAADDEIDNIFSQAVEQEVEEHEDYVRIQAYVTRRYRKMLEDRFGKDKIGAVIRHAIHEYISNH